MILTCPNCQTQFAIDAALLSPKGRKVKCSRCKHDWYEQPPVLEQNESEAEADTVISELEAKVEQSSTAPAAQKTGSALESPAKATKAPPPPKAAGPALKIATVAIWLLAAGSVFLALLPMLGDSPLSRGLSLQPTRDFAMQEIGLSLKGGKDKKVGIVFNGAVLNLKAETKPAPIVTITLYDHLDREMRSLAYEFPTANVGPQGTLAFDPKINNIPDSLSRVVLELGNAAERSLR